MNESPFGETDLATLAAHGIAESEARRQIGLLRHPPARHPLDRPCTLGDGIERIAPERHAELASAHDAAAHAGRWTRFVPASGAATRMFHALVATRHDLGPTHADLERAASHGSADARVTLRCLDALERFAFHDALERVLAAGGGSLAACRARGDVRTVLDAMLGASGLALATRPKGLIEFHLEGVTARTAFEEQLAEAITLGRDADGRVRTHFTVSREHQPEFAACLARVRAELGRALDARLDNAFSIQQPASDTLALAEDGAPFRHEGRLLLRPSGHGALIDNLAASGADLVAIKNVDNVQPRSRRGPTLMWLRVLGGRLLELERRAHALLRRLEDPADHGAVGDALAFERSDFGAGEPTPAAALPTTREDAWARLHRPLRVCGMVANTGEPGGGPFWVRGRDGALTRQIVESAEIDPARPDQRAVFARGTHFNPVFLVGALRDHRGTPYPLADFIDPDAVIVTSKSSHGRALTALERPGLWNGAMARWRTVFVEVPDEVFTPVKTLEDLLRPAHQPGPS